MRFYILCGSLQNIGIEADEIPATSDAAFLAHASRAKIVTRHFTSGSFKELSVRLFHTVSPHTCQLHTRSIQCLKGSNPSEKWCFSKRSNVDKLSTSHAACCRDETDPSKQKGP
jgi:hypothetical protein